MVKAPKQPDVNGNVAAINEAEIPVIVKLALSPELYAEYEELASVQQLTVAELILDRLTRCKTHASIRSLYFHTSQLAQLENILAKRPIESAEHALVLLRNALTIRIGEFEPIPITAQQAKRLALSAYGGLTVQERLNQIVQPAISKAVGI